METPAISPAATQPVAATSDNTASNISADFETFLKMLTVQLQNQDPLNPIDSADYAVQLATFSGVEQQVQTNDLLRGLALSMGAQGLADMAGWVGMEARSNAPAYFNGTPITVSPTPDPSADAAQLVVRDDQGTVVQRIDIATSADPLVWQGIDGNGIGFLPGQYSFETISYALGRQISETPSQTYQQVSEVQLVDGQNVLILAGGVQINATDVTALRDPSGS